MQIVIDEPKLTLSFYLNMLKIGKGRDAQKIPLKRITSLEIRKDCTIDSKLLMALYQSHVHISFDIGRRTPILIENASIAHTKLDIKSAWHNIVTNTPIQQELARRVVLNKIKRQTNVIRSLSLRMHIHNMDIGKCLAHGTSLNILPNTEISSLMGIEGSSAKYYYQALKVFIPAWCGFTQRIKRPPTDPANAILSYTYTHAMHIVTAALIASGFHIAYGVLHKNLDYRPSLSCDILERFRAQIDIWVIDLLNKTLQPTHFQVVCPTTQKMILTPKGQRIYFIHFNQLKPVLERYVKRHVRRIKTTALFYHTAST